MGVFDFLKKKKGPVAIPEGFGTSRWESVDRSPMEPIQKPPGESAYAKFKRGMGKAKEKIDQIPEAVGEEIGAVYKGTKTYLEERRLTDLEKMGAEAKKLKLKNELAAQKQSLRAKGEDTWGKFARNAERGQKVATGVGKILKKASTLGGPIPGPLSNKGLYIPVKQKGMYFDPEGTRALTLPGGNQEQANGGLRGASTPHLGMLRQAGAPPMRKPQMPRPQSLSFQSHKVGSTYDLSLLRGLTLPKGTSKIEKIAIGEVQIHQGSFKDVLAGLKIAGYSQGQSISALSSLQKKGVLVKGADNSLELTGGQR